MELIRWESNFNTGDTGIDEQHKILVGYLNRLFDAMKEGRGFKVLSEILDGLTEYTVNHFGHEEKLMKTFEYPEIQNHIKEHKALVDEIIKFKKEFEARKISLSIDLMDYLKDWLTNHILQTDKKLGKFLQQKGI